MTTRLVDIVLQDVAMDERCPGCSRTDLDKFVFVWRPELRSWDGLCQECSHEIFAAADKAFRAGLA